MIRFDELQGCPACGVYASKFSVRFCMTRHVTGPGMTICDADTLSECGTPHCHRECPNCRFQFITEVYDLELLTQVIEKSS